MRTLLPPTLRLTPALILALTLAACGEEPTPDPATPSPTVTASPTQAPTPTPTTAPTPTATPAPTATATEAPTPTTTATPTAAPTPAPTAAPTPTATQAPDSDGDGALDGADCAPDNPAIFPGATEVCGGVDDDCDSRVDEDATDAPQWAFDNDGDGVAGTTGLTTACAAPISGMISVVGDCDDTDPSLYPGATEACDQADQDCDGEIDEGLSPVTYYGDGDGDGYGDPADPILSCDGAPGGAVASAGDCDDGDDARSPEAADDQCDAVDDDCDGRADEAYNQDRTEVLSCNGVTLANTCVAGEILRPAESFASNEVCDELDNDCDGWVDELDGSEGVTSLCNEICDGLDDDFDGAIDEDFDRDGDGFATCAGDCNDQDSASNPGAAEICNLRDDDCDGSTDESPDQDADGYTICDGDCDDSSAAINPGHDDDECDDVDQNCNGMPDENYNADGSLFCRCNVQVVTYSCVGGEASCPIEDVASDELMDGRDNDCDGETDEDGWYIDAGYYRGVARAPNGQVWEWSVIDIQNGVVYGSPTLKDFLPPMRTVVSGYDHALGIAEDGRVVEWGPSPYVSSGSGTLLAPGIREVSALGPALGVAAGSRFSIALLEDGTVWSWGNNDYGQLGDGSTNQRLSPAKIPGLENIIEVSAKYRFALALREDGAVFGWGTGVDGQLGSAHTGEVNPQPILLPISAPVMRISAGAYFELFLMEDGTVQAMGHGAYGQLGDGLKSSSPVPVVVSGLSDVVDLSAGAFLAAALTLDGDVYRWGDYDGSDGRITATTPQLVSEIRDVRGVSSGYYCSHVMVSDDYSMAWGENSFYQLGNGRSTDTTDPVQVSLPLNAPTPRP